MKYKKRLKTLADCRRYLAALANSLDAGELTETKARTLTYIVSILMQAVEKADIEDRLTILETQVKERYAKYNPN